MQLNREVIRSAVIVRGKTPADDGIDIIFASLARSSRQVFRSFLVVAVLVSILHSKQSLAQSPPPNQRQQDWKKELKRLSFAAPDECGLQSSLKRFDANCKLRIDFDPRDRELLTFEFEHNGKITCSPRGHIQSAFIAHKDTVYFTDYQLLSSGCVVSAYDLQSGKMIWSTKLHGKEPEGHSAYSNRVSMRLSNPDEVNGDPGGDAVVVNGQESYCDYIEALDSKTGASLAVRLYRVGYIQPESEQDSGR